MMALAISIASAPATFANADTNAAPTPAAPVGSTDWIGHHHNHANLTDAERSQLKSAEKQALAANPSLKTQKHELKKQFEALAANKATATPDQFKALHQQRKALHQQLRDAELKVDPKLAPIFAKIDAAKHGHHHSS